MTDEPGPELLAALVEESAKKSAVLWLSYLGVDRPRPAWHVWADGVVLLVVDADGSGTEQRLPGLVEATTATVTCRAKDGRDRLVSWQAEVHRIEPGTPEWDAAGKALRGNRLNATDVATLPERWAHNAAILALRPTGEVSEYPGRMPSEEAAAPPPGSPATTRGKLPWVFGRRANRARRLS